jgi:hypothetical protein
MADGCEALPAHFELAGTVFGNMVDKIARFRDEGLISLVCKAGVVEAELGL